MACEHHHKVYHRQDQEHLIDTAVSKVLQHSLHDRAGDRLRRTETCHCQAGRKTLPVFKPEHKRLNGGQITGSKTDTHNKTVTYVDTDKRQRALLMLSAVINEKSGTCHTCRETDRCDQG